MLNNPFTVLMAFLFWYPNTHCTNNTDIDIDACQSLEAGWNIAYMTRGSYCRIVATNPAPTVRPPSRIAKRIPFSIAIG